MRDLVEYLMHNYFNFLDDICIKLYIDVNENLSNDEYEILDEIQKIIQIILDKNEFSVKWKFEIDVNLKLENFIVLLDCWYFDCPVSYANIFNKCGNGGSKNSLMIVKNNIHKFNRYCREICVSSVNDDKYNNIYHAIV